MTKCILTRRADGKSMQRADYILNSILRGEVLLIDADYVELSDATKKIVNEQIKRLKELQNGSK